MKISKKLLFLVCISSIWTAFAMDIKKYRSFYNVPITKISSEPLLGHSEATNILNNQNLHVISNFFSKFNDKGYNEYSANVKSNLSAILHTKANVMNYTLEDINFTKIEALVLQQHEINKLKPWQRYHQFVYGFATGMLVLGLGLKVYTYFRPNENK